MKRLIAILSCVLILFFNVNPVYAAYGDDLKADYPTKYDFIMNSGALNHAKQSEYYWMVYNGGYVFIYGFSDSSSTTPYIVSNNGVNDMYYLTTVDGVTNLYTKATVDMSYEQSLICNNVTENNYTEDKGNIYNERLLSNMTQGQIVTTNIPIFNTYEDLLNYRNSGDISGCVNPEVLPIEYPAPKFFKVDCDKNFVNVYYEVEYYQDLLGFKNIPLPVSGVFTLYCHDENGKNYEEQRSFEANLMQQGNKLYYKIDINLEKNLPSSKELKYMYDRLSLISYYVVSKPNTSKWSFVDYDFSNNNFSEKDNYVSEKPNNNGTVENPQVNDWYTHPIEEVEGDIIGFIKGGFGIFGSNGLFAMFGQVFSWIPTPILACISSGVALVFVAIVYRLVRG